MMQRVTIRAEPELIERVKRRAAQRGVSVSQFCREAMRHELGPDEERIPPPLTCIGAFDSGRSDLSEIASEDVFGPEPWVSP
jgi:plasmid stability protein